MAKVSKNRKKELLKVKLAEIIRRESSNAAFDFVTITKVEVSPDFTYANIFYSSIELKPDEGELTKDLNKASGFFQSKLGHAMTTRNTPKLVFVYDEGLDHAGRIDELLHKINDQ